MQFVAWRQLPSTGCPHMYLPCLRAELLNNFNNLRFQTRFLHSAFTLFVFYFLSLFVWGTGASNVLVALSPDRSMGRAVVCINFKTEIAGVCCCVSCNRLLLPRPIIMKSVCCSVSVCLVICLYLCVCLFLKCL